MKGKKIPQPEIPETMDTPKQVINNVNKDCNVFNGPVTGSTIIMHSHAAKDADEAVPVPDTMPEAVPAEPRDEHQIQPPPSCARDQAIRKSLTELMDIKENGKPLFRNKGHWVAVYRVIVDARIIRGSYKDFARFIADKLPDNLQTPFSYETLKKTITDSCLYHRPLEEWEKADSSEIPYQSYRTMHDIAWKFRAILERNQVL